MNFVLYADGKFKLSYDYDKPEGYEESDETITLEDAVNRLSRLGASVDESNLAWKPQPIDK